MLSSGNWGKSLSTLYPADNSPLTLLLFFSSHTSSWGHFSTVWLVNDTVYVFASLLIVCS